MISSLPKNSTHRVTPEALSLPTKSALVEQLKSKQSLLPKRVEQIVANFKENIRKMNRQQAIGLIGAATLATIALCYKICCSGYSREQPSITPLIQNNTPNEIQSGSNASLVVAQQNVSETQNSISHILKQLSQCPLENPNEETTIAKNPLPTRIEAFTPLANRSLLMIPAPSEFCPAISAETNNHSLRPSQLTSPAIITSPLPIDTLPLMQQLHESVATNPNPSSTLNDTAATHSNIITDFIDTLSKVANLIKNSAIPLFLFIGCFVNYRKTPVPLSSIRLDQIKYFDPSVTLLRLITTTKTCSTRDIKSEILDERRGYLAQEAIKAFNHFKLETNTYQTKVFNCNNEFKLEEGRYPAYFLKEIIIDEKFPSSINISPCSYDYKGSSANAAAPASERKDNDPISIFSHTKICYVNPANKLLGGHALTNNGGFALEEKMAFETPDMLNIVSENPNIKTRYGKDTPAEGYPTPILFEGLHRVLDIDQSLYGRNNLYDEQINIQEGNLVKQLDEAMTYDSLAIASPWVSLQNSNGTNASKYKAQDIQTLADFFNTIYAGFLLAKSANYTYINSTLIGCGAFGNDTSCGICLQALVAEYLGVSLKIHRVDPGIMTAAEQLWSKAFGQIDPKSPPTIYEAIQMLSKAAKS